MQKLLASWSKSQSFSINLTFLSRLPLNDQVNDIVGEFTSVTLLAVENSYNSTFIERARKIQNDLWNDLEHHDISGVQILRELIRIYGGATEAKMPVVFTSALTVPVPDQEAAPIPFKPIYKDGVTQTSQVWLDCGIWEDTHNLLCNWDVVEDLYPEGFLREMYECFWKLIERLANNEKLWDAKVLSLLPVSQQNSREQWNNTVAPISDEYMHTLFLKQAKLQPDHIAIITQNKTITYKNLRSIMNRLSRLIRELGAKPNQMVAIVMEKGWEQTLAALAIQNAGAAYLPIDSDIPKERLDFLIYNGDVSVVLTQSWLYKTIKWIDDVTIISVDTVDLSKYNDTDLDVVQSQDDLAYTIFTSGSTGVPKGVMISHRGAVNTILDINNRFHVKNDDHVLAISNLNFDLSVYDLFGSLAAGATIVIPENENKLDPIHWHHLIQDKGVTIWNSVPQLMCLYTEYIQTHGKEIPESLRLVMMSGDWIPLRLPDQIRVLSENVNIEIISLGGATEASIWSILYPIEIVQNHWNSIPYGKPMINQTYHVLNSHLEPCPNWVVGDLYIGGIGLALGYWKDEEKTNTSFIFHHRTGERLYRTGDLGRYMPDGNIEFQGREDNQVKINGYRVELDEIETIMKKYSGINEVIVNFTGELRENKSLVGYYTLKNEVSIDVQELRAYLKEKLPEYLIPVAFMEIKQLPLTPNGKIDRKVLPNINETLIQTKKEYFAPRDEYETFIAELWIDILKLERINIHDNFFEVGGNSMQAHDKRMNEQFVNIGF